MRKISERRGATLEEPRKWKRHAPSSVAPRRRVLHKSIPGVETPGLPSPGRSATFGQVGYIAGHITPTPRARPRPTAGDDWPTSWESGGATSPRVPAVDCLLGFGVVAFR